jgi:hypothetical protein
MKDLRPLLIEAFPENWEEVFALSMLRANGIVPLKRAESSWQKIYNVDSIDPDLSSKNLSNP